MFMRERRGRAGEKKKRKQGGQWQPVLSYVCKLTAFEFWTEIWGPVNSATALMTLGTSLNFFCDSISCLIETLTRLCSMDQEKSFVCKVFQIHIFWVINKKNPGPQVLLSKLRTLIPTFDCLP